MADSDTGVCRYCLKTFTGRGMSRHLQTCAEKHKRDSEQEAGKKRLKRIYHLKIAGTYNPRYWLQLEMDATATLDKLDAFLRDVWLECCGHLSEFTIGRRQAMFEDDFMSFMGGGMPGDSLMEEKIGDVLAPKERFSYTYDFGSSTELEGCVVGERRGVLPSPVVILARNDPPEYRCEACEKRVATQVDVEGPAFLCNTCARHEDGELDEMCLPLVNSPRAGVCAYSGEFDPDTFVVPRPRSAA